MIGALLAGTYLVFLFLHDPRQGGFPSCPFRWLTGWACPGCGSQRALHELMHGQLLSAFGHNALLVIALPMLATQFAVDRWGRLERPLIARNTVVRAWVIVVIGWGVARNFL